MKLSTRSRYGLRAMIAIARRPGEFRTSELVAGEQEVSKKYLDSILGRLREVGLLEAERGMNGGYRLGRPPEAITAADVVEALEGEMTLVPCLKDVSACRRAPRCPTRGVWRAASDAIRGVLAELTLAELARRAPALEPAEAMYFI